MPLAEAMVHRQSDGPAKADLSIVMPDLIGHPWVHVGVQEPPRGERGRVGPRLRGG